MSLYPAPILPDVVREHLEEVAFLFVQRRKLLFSAEAAPGRLAAHDERIAAHREGLLVGRPVSLRLAEEFLDSDDPWYRFAGAWTWLDLGDPPPAAVTDRMGGAEDEEAAGAWREAFRRVSAERIARWFPGGPTEVSAAPARAVVADAFGWHGMLSADALRALAADEAEAVRAAAARAAGWGAEGAPLDRPLFEALLADPAQAVRRRAAWSLFLRDADEGLSWCRKQLRDGDPDPFFFRLVGTAGFAEDVPLLAGGLGVPGTAQQAAEALGALGRLSGAFALLECLEAQDAVLRAAAARALARILGEARDEAGGMEAPFSEEEAPAVSPEVVQVWRARLGELDPSLRLRRGIFFPAEGKEHDIPMESLWHIVLLRPLRGFLWLRKEVPDGFFADEEAGEAIPGE